MLACSTLFSNGGKRHNAQATRWELHPATPIEDRLRCIPPGVPRAGHQPLLPLGSIGRGSYRQLGFSDERLPVWASLRSLLCAALFPTAPLSRGGCSSLRLTPLSSARFNTPPKQSKDKPVGASSPRDHTRPVRILGSCEAGLHLAVVAHELCDGVRDDHRGAWPKADRPAAGAEPAPAGRCLAITWPGSSNPRGGRSGAAEEPRVRRAVPRGLPVGPT